MKKFILTLSLVAVVSSSLVSCSTDDSALEKDKNADGFGISTPIDNGDKDFPKPPIRA